MEQEIWKDIKGYEWKYQISNLGNIKSYYIYRLKSITKNSKWYNIVQLWIWWKNKVYSVHRLVAQSFIPNPENKPCVNHIDWNRINNKIDNLEWCTQSENIRHKFDVLWYKSVMQKTWWPSKWKKWWLNHLSKKVNQYDLQGNFIKTWNSMSDIERQVNIPRSSISLNCKWKLKTAWWYIWKFT